MDNNTHLYLKFVRVQFEKSPKMKNFPVQHISERFAVQINTMLNSYFFKLKNHLFNPKKSGTSDTCIIVTPKIIIIDTILTHTYIHALIEFNTTCYTDTLKMIVN